MGREIAPSAIYDVRFVDFFAESERLVFKNYTKIGTVARERAVLGLIRNPGSATVPILYKCWILYNCCLVSTPNQLSNNV